MSGEQLSECWRWHGTHDDEEHRRGMNPAYYLEAFGIIGENNTLPIA